MNSYAVHWSNETTFISSSQVVSYWGVLENSTGRKWHMPLRKSTHISSSMEVPHITNFHKEKTQKSSLPRQITTQSNCVRICVREVVLRIDVRHSFFYLAYDDKKRKSDGSDLLIFLRWSLYFRSFYCYSYKHTNSVRIARKNIMKEIELSQFSNNVSTLSLDSHLQSTVVFRWIDNSFKIQDKTTIA